MMMGGAVRGEHPPPAGGAGAGQPFRESVRRPASAAGNVGRAEAPQRSAERSGSALAPPGAPTLLVSLWYPEGEMAGPPFSTPLAQVAALFDATQSIKIAESRDGLSESQNLKDRGVSSLDETAYILRRKAD